jgi:hypothetical protein
LGLHPFDEVVHQAVNGAQAHRRRSSQQIWLISGELVDEDEPLLAEAQALMVRLLTGRPSSRYRRSGPRMPASVTATTPAV